MTTPREKYTVVLEALPDDDRQATIRLRLALGHLLRTQRLRCLSIVEVPPAADHNPTKPVTE
jgi:hypothetical protein